MSHEAFNVRYSIDDLATMLANVIRRNEYSPPTIAKLRRTLKTLRLAEAMTQRVQHLEGGIETEAEFHDNWLLFCVPPTDD